MNIGDLPTVKFFDKFIHVEFEEYMSVADARKLYEAEELKRQQALLERGAAYTNVNPTDAQWEGFLDSVTGKFRIETPRTGVKPRIAASVKFIPFMRVSEVTLSIKNVEIDVDINRFTFMRVRMGYFNGPSVMFRGSIMNSYVESPNPNGNTVFQMLATGILEDMLDGRAITLAAFGPSYWIKGLEAVCAALKFPLDRTDFNSAYDKIPLLDEPKKRLNFKSMQDVVNYFQDAANGLFPRYGLKPPTISLSAEAIRVTSNDNGVIVKGVKETAQELNMIKTASFTGGGIMIKAPYNPFITPMSYFHIDPVYFRGRFNSQNMRTWQNMLGGVQMTGLATESVAVKNGEATVKQDFSVGVAEDGYYRVLNMSVQFDTYNVNEMQVLGVMANATRDNSETLDNAIADYQRQAADSRMRYYPPDSYPPFFEEVTPAEQETAAEGGAQVIVISENKTERVSTTSARETLSTILNKYIEEDFAEPKYAIEFKIGDANKIWLNKYRYNRQTSNGLFAASRENWFSIHTMLINGDKTGVSLVEATRRDPLEPLKFGENIFGAAAQKCLQGLADRIIELERDYIMPEGGASRTIYSVFFTLCQRAWFNQNKNDLDPAIAPYVSGYILPGEQLLPNIRIKENDAYCDNDLIYSELRNSEPIRQKEYTMRLAGPDWAKCLKKSGKLAALFKELTAWAENNRAYGFESADFALAASRFKP